MQHILRQLLPDDPEPGANANPSLYWRSLLGAKFTEELIEQAHADAARRTGIMGRSAFKTKCKAEGCGRSAVDGASYCSDDHYDELVAERIARKGYRLSTPRPRDYTIALPRASKRSALTTPRKVTLLAPEKPKLAETFVTKYEGIAVGDSIETYGDFVDKATIGFGKTSSKEIEAIKPFLVFRTIRAAYNDTVHIYPVTFHDVPFISLPEWKKETGMSFWPCLVKEKE